jgi:hypothetical protein
MGIIICEKGFDDPDNKNPDYSMREVDFYAFVPFVKQREYGVKSHRLSLRKNLKTKKFEVYRFYSDTGEEEVVFSGDFNGALSFANKEREKYWGFIGKIEPDIACQHEYPIIDKWFCPNYYR